MYNFISLFFKKLFYQITMGVKLQEGPDKISVFGIPNRSTGAVEVTNGVFGKNIPAHAHFFRFVLALRTQEWHKAKMAKSIVNSGGETCPARKGKSKVRIAL